VPFTAQPSATDKQVADAVYRTLQLPLTRPMPDWFLRRTPENDLLLDFYNINGIWLPASAGRLPGANLPPEGGSHEPKAEATSRSRKPRAEGGSHEPKPEATSVSPNLDQPFVVLLV
jgi:hypothetical protein